MPNTGTVDFWIAGQKITVKAGQLDPDVLEEVTELAKAKLIDAERRAGGIAPHYIVLLALLELSEDYVRSKRKTAQFKRNVHDKIERMQDLLEPQVSQRERARRADRESTV